MMYMKGYISFPTSIEKKKTLQQYDIGLGKKNKTKQGNNTILWMLYVPPALGNAGSPQ